MFRAEWARAVAIIARATGDVGLAEDAVQEAFVRAVARWPVDGPPVNPAAWIVTTARNGAIDQLRRQRTDRRAVAALAAVLPQVSVADEVDDAAVPDERLALIFACCHPALSIESRVALTLRLVGGLTTEQIARGFLTAPATMAQRLSRARSKIRGARVPVAVPAEEDLPERVDAALAVVYLVFNQGYSDLDRPDLAHEAIRLGAILAELRPDDAEVHGLHALMLLQESRRGARRDDRGEIVRLEEQDRAVWDRRLVAAGLDALRRSTRVAGGGPYQVQAAIAACHAVARRAEDTDWRAIIALYGQLAAMTANPVVELNRAVAVLLAGDTEDALAAIDAVASVLDHYHPLHLARAEALHVLGRDAEARVAFARAGDLAPTAAERRHIAHRLDSLPRG